MITGAERCVRPLVAALHSPGTPGDGFPAALDSAGRASFASAAHSFDDPRHDEAEGDKTDQRDEDSNEIDRGTVIYDPTGGFEFFEFVFHVSVIVLRMKR